MIVCISKKQSVSVIKVGKKLHSEPAEDGYVFRHPEKSQSFVRREIDMQGRFC